MYYLHLIQVLHGEVYFSVTYVVKIERLGEFIHSVIQRTDLNEPSGCSVNSSTMDNNPNLFLAINCCISGVMFFIVGTIRINGDWQER